MLIREKEGNIRRMAVKTAFSSWNNRIAPVFDVARQLFLVEIESGAVTSEAEEILPADEPGAKVRKLAELGVKALVCGAISRFLHDLVTSYGITVVPFVAGDLREVVRAWVENRLDDEFAMPGCCGRICGRPGDRGGREPCVARQDRAERDRALHAGAARNLGRGRRGDFHEHSSRRPDGLCICPRCGRREPNEARRSCLHIQCPVCGGMMIRET